jgi:hypothetical protein
MTITSFYVTRHSFQKEYSRLLTTALQIKQRNLHSDESLVRTAAEIDQVLKRLKYLSTSFERELTKLLTKSDDVMDYLQESAKIKALIHSEIRPMSRSLESKEIRNIHRFTFKNALQMSLLSEKLHVVPIAFISTLYLFLGIQFTFGISFALVQCAIYLLPNLIIYFGTEALLARKYILRKAANTFIIIGGFLTPIMLSEFLPTNFNFSDEFFSPLIVHLFLLTLYFAALGTYNLSEILDRNREGILARLGVIIDSEIKSGPQNFVSTEDYSFMANYLHGEIQSGLTACSHLLIEAAETGDVAMGKKALFRAAKLLNQDHHSVSRELLVDSLSNLEAVAAAWEGIAEIDLSFENDVVESSTFPIAVTLIQEGISNAIRHSSATVIGIRGFIYEDSVRYVISSNGEVKKERGKGLGTVLFDELTNNWSLKRSKDSNQLQFDLNK